MASSSKTHIDFYNPQEKEEELGEDDHEEDRLELELGLGFCTACRNPTEHKSNTVLAPASMPITSSSSSRNPQETGLGIGLGLGSWEGFRNLGVTPPAGSNYSGSWENQLQEQQHHYHRHDMPSLTLFTTSRPSWPRHMDSRSFHGLGNRETPVPYDSYDDYTRRLNSGLWFTLRSSINREGDVLPQIPKAYIRVKDENVTVFMVKTYLVRKLGLSNEAEIDISCMGQKLLHSQTLKHVRDAVWLPRLVESVNSSSTAFVDNSPDMSVNHLMSLHYGRRCFMN